MGSRGHTLARYGVIRVVGQFRQGCNLKLSRCIKDESCL